MLSARFPEIALGGGIPDPFPELAVADNDVEGIEEGAEQPWKAVPEPALEQVAPPEARPGEQHQKPQVAARFRTHPRLHQVIRLHARVEIELAQKLADRQVGVVQHVVVQLADGAADFQLFVDVSVRELRLALPEKAQLRVRVLAAVAEPVPEVVVAAVELEGGVGGVGVLDFAKLRNQCFRQSLVWIEVEYPVAACLLDPKGFVDVEVAVVRTREDTRAVAFHDGKGVVLAFAVHIHHLIRPRKPGQEFPEVIGLVVADDGDAEGCHARCV